MVCGCHGGQVSDKDINFVADHCGVPLVGSVPRPGLLWALVLWYQGLTGKEETRLSTGEKVKMLRDRFQPKHAERMQGIVCNRKAGKMANEQDWILEHKLAIQKIQGIGGLKDGVNAVQEAREAGMDVTELCANLSMQIMKITMLLQGAKVPQHVPGTKGCHPQDCQQYLISDLNDLLRVVQTHTVF